VRAKGGVVLTKLQSNEVYQGSAHLPWNSRFIDLDSTCYDDPARRGGRELLGDLCPLCRKRHNGH